MATPMKPFVQGGGYYPSRVWTPFVRGNGFTTQDGGEKQGVPKMVSGALIHITDALSAPVSALSVAIEPVQSGSGDPAPDNVRPISGWTEAKVWREATYDPTANPALTIDLDETRYGGTLDVLTGVLTVNRVGITPTVDLLQSINTYGIANFRFSLSDASIKAADQAKAICSALKYQTSLISGTTEQGFILSSASIGYLRIPQEIANTKEIAQSWVSANNVIVVYYLATPLTVQLTPATLSTLLGENNVWADTGDTTMTYMAEGD